MAARELLEVTPTVLRWAREAAGYSVEDVAKKLGVKSDRIELWESGKAGVPEGRLDALADIYKRPSAIFFLEEPPDEQVIEAPDFRRKADRRPPSPSLKLQIRRAIERAESYVDLAEDLGIEVPTFSFECSLDEDVEQVGARLRATLGLTDSEQLSWDGNKSRAFARWRELAEENGVLVFQTSRAQIDEARGISLRIEPLPVAIIASGDAPAGRTYTLLHELTHLGLQESGLCDQHDEGVEKFCNEVAAAALMPRHLVARFVGAGRAIDTKVLSKVSRALGVSEQALALRLVEMKILSWSSYRAMRSHFDQLAAIAREKMGGGPVPQPTLALSRNGRVFTSVVLDALHRHKISAHRASLILNIGARYLPDLTRDIARVSLSGMEV